VRKLLLTLLILTLFISVSYSQLSVKIVSPKNGETVSGNVTIKVEVSDPTNVSKVEFYINNEKVGEVTKSPFEYILYTTLYPNGEYTIIVRVYEKTGLMTGVRIKIWIENTHYTGWQKTYGGSGDDRAYSIQQTTDGGYIIAGKTGDFYSGDVYIIKLDKDGNKMWEKTFGGSGDDGAYSIQQTTDGGYIVAGWTNSFGAGNWDIYVIKLDANGNMVWEKTYGGNDYDLAYSIQQTTDGGYIVAGWTNSFGAGESDFYIIKPDENGNKVWEKTYGGNDYDLAYSIQQTTDGGYIVAGWTNSFGAGNWDIYVIKLDENGNKVWEKTYGGGGDDLAYSIQQTTDGGYIIAGGTNSFGAGDCDVYVLKLDEDGNMIWEDTFGGSNDDLANSIQQTKDGGYIVAGEKKSFGAGDRDVYIIKLDENGNMVWEKTYGGSGDDSANSIQQTKDGGYIVAGYTESFGAGGWDVYIIKMDAEGNTGPYPTK